MRRTRKQKNEYRYQTKKIQNIMYKLQNFRNTQNSKTNIIFYNLSFSSSSPLSTTPNTLPYVPCVRVREQHMNKQAAYTEPITQTQNTNNPNKYIAFCAH